jgi:hypothetical protein
MKDTDTPYGWRCILTQTSGPIQCIAPYPTPRLGALGSAQDRGSRSCICFNDSTLTGSRVRPSAAVDTASQRSELDLIILSGHRGCAGRLDQLIDPRRQLRDPERYLDGGAPRHRGPVSAEVRQVERRCRRGARRTSGGESQSSHRKKPEALRRPVNGEPTRGTGPGWLRCSNSLLLSTPSTRVCSKQVHVLVFGLVVVDRVDEAGSALLVYKPDICPEQRSRRLRGFRGPFLGPVDARDAGFADAHVDEAFPALRLEVLLLLGRRGSASRSTVMRSRAQTSTPAVFVLTLQPLHSPPSRSDEMAFDRLTSSGHR